MMSSNSKEKILARNKIIEQLSCASTAFGLSLPKPSGSIYKQVFGLKKGQGVTKATSSQQSTHFEQGTKNDIFMTSKAKESFRKYIIRDMWAMLEREMKLTDIANPLPAVKMPLITLQELKIHLHENFGWKRSSGFAISISEDSFSQCLAEIDGFIAEAERTRILAIHIGGHDPHQENQRCPGIKEEKVPIEITLVAFNGVMLKFSDIPLIPSPLQNILSDVAYAKISSTPDIECQLLQKFGIRLRGWIHSGAVFRALIRKDSRFGIQTQAKYLESEGFVNSSPEFSGLMDDQTNCSHDCAWVPIAITLASAIKFALKRSYPSTYQMFPVIWEALALVSLRVPEDLENISNDPVKNWMPGKNRHAEMEHQNVNDVVAMQAHRRMSADFVEIFDPAYNPKEAAESPVQLFIDPKGFRLYLPPATVLKGMKPEKLLKTQCNNCGQHRHSAQECLSRRRSIPVCNYPHDDVPDLPPHSICFCPVLHFRCLECTGRGHYQIVHERKEFTPRELRQRFFEHAHLGYISSLPFLTLIPEAMPWIGSNHFVGGFLGRPFRHDAITRNQLGISAEICAAYAQPQLGYEDRDEMVAVKLDRIKKNAEADDPQDIVPIPKTLLQGVLKQRNKKLEAQQNKLSSTY